jgi:hypothetical protein
MSAAGYALFRGRFVFEDSYNAMTPDGEEAIVEPFHWQQLWWFLDPPFEI